MKRSIIIICAAAVRFAVAETAPAAPESTAPGNKTFFIEKFEDNPVKRFSLTPSRTGKPNDSGCELKYDAEERSWTVGGNASLTRPAQAGSRVTLTVDLKFGQGGEGPASGTKTGFYFVLGNRSSAGIDFVFSGTEDRPAAVRFVQIRPGRPGAVVLREITTGGPDATGDWQLSFDHGLMTLKRGTSVLGGAYCGDPHGQVSGVTWSQQGGRTTCRQMAMTGDPGSRLGAEAAAQLNTAIRSNQEAKRLLDAKQTDEALAKMKESSALFVKVYGEGHPEAANSFANLGAILKAAGKPEEAREFMAKALSIHEKSLGAAHPHTTLSRFNLGDSALRSGDAETARKVWTRCMEDWTTVLGPDYPMVDSLRGLLKKF